MKRETISKIISIVTMAVLVAGGAIAWYAMMGFFK